MSDTESLEPIGGAEEDEVALPVAADDIRAQIVWSKNRFALGRGDYHWQHEPCWYAVRKGTRSHWQGARDQSTLWSIAPAGVEDTATTHQ